MKLIITESMATIILLNHAIMLFELLLVAAGVDFFKLGDEMAPSSA